MAGGKFLLAVNFRMTSREILHVDLRMVGRHLSTGFNRRLSLGLFRILHDLLFTDRHLLFAVEQRTSAMIASSGAPAESMPQKTIVWFS